ncbi:MAG: hypothetical protein K8H88_04765 [Sandaracinaceae bacterium]|nr:hypothetical protein [Sandaracinaceae bacterium]
MTLSVQSSPPPPPRILSQRPLISANDVRSELQRLFGGGSDGQLVVSVYGSEDDAGVVATFDELMHSLHMHGGGPSARGLPDMLVQAPDAALIERALSVLGRQELQRQVLDQVLTTFGRRLIDPLGDVLDTSPTGAIMAALIRVRGRLLTDVRDLSVTSETRSILANDVAKLLDDEYLAMLADHEERVQRPRVKKLAQEILRLIGDNFHAALERWPRHAGAIAASAARRIGSQATLRELPELIRAQVVAGIEEFLWVETSAHIEGALAAMFRAHRDIVERPPVLEREAYHEFAEGCWTLIASHS